MYNPDLCESLILISFLCSNEKRKKKRQDADEILEPEWVVSVLAGFGFVGMATFVCTTDFCFFDMDRTTIKC